MLREKNKENLIGKMTADNMTQIYSKKKKSFREASYSFLSSFNIDYFKFRCNKDIFFLLVQALFKFSNYVTKPQSHKYSNFI